MSERGPRTRAEWTTLGVSTAIVLVIAALIGMQSVSDPEPALPVAALDGPVEVAGERFHVPVVVRNDGDETAAAVQVVASLTIDGEVDDADQVVDFLPGGASEHLVFAFDDDPADGELDVHVAGFARP